LPLLLVLALPACAAAPTPVATAPVPTSDYPAPTPASIAAARADSARLPYTLADIRFMTGMIGHHAQAVHISRWAESHGASAEVQRLGARIINAQRDEIRTMQTWLANRQQPVPDPEHAMMGHHDMPGMAMHGMLTPAQLAELDAARDAAFDRLFLRFMIQHHKGAVRMVDELFASDRGGQDEIVFKFANDVQVDQRTEVARMERMLAERVFQTGESR
jgi:uncharacterized protein (DUF305 family)